MTQPTLAEAQTWFKDTLISQRTASAGLSANRLWKTPASFITGNVEDANGLCGDAALYVAETFWKTFGDYTTSDGYHIGMVLWEGRVLNHMANIMLKKATVRAATYTYHSASGIAKEKGKTSQYTSAAFLGLDVFDLYYKKASDLKSWWGARDSAYGGTVRIGLQHDFA